MTKKEKLDIVAVRLVKDKKLMSEQQIRFPSDAVRILGQEMAQYSREVFAVIHIDAQHRPICATYTSMGMVNRVNVHPRETFQAAILANAAAVVVLHNHPSGSPSPSKEDIDVTETLCRAGKLLGIEVLDHIIVGDHGRYFSFAENKILKDFGNKLLPEEQNYSLPGINPTPEDRILEAVLNKELKLAAGQRGR